MVFIFIGFIGLLVSSSVHEMTLVYGYVWKDISVNAYGISMTSVAVGIMRMMRASHERVKRGCSDSERRKRSRGGDRRRRRSPSGMERIHLEGKSREIKMYVAWVAVCLVTALASTFLLKADLRTSVRAVGSFLLFGTPDPYVAPSVMERVENEMREDMIKILK